MSTPTPTFEQRCAFAVGLMRLLKQHAPGLPTKVMRAIEQVEDAARECDAAKLTLAYAAALAAATATYATATAAAYATAAYATTTATTTAATYAATAGVPSEHITTLQALTIGT